MKLADFGIARAMDRAGLTDPGTVKGKAAYMAPEQARGDAVDARADVFSLGVVLWELCAGRRLFARESDAATLAAVLSDEPVSPPSAWNEEVPAELDRVILGALERDPARRTRLRPGARDRARRRPPPASSARRRTSTSARSCTGSSRRRWRRSRRAPPEPTRVRPVAMAAEPVAEPSPVPPAADEPPTRTVAAAATRRGAGGAWAAAGGAAVAARRRSRWAPRAGRRRARRRPRPRARPFTRS